MERLSDFKPLKTVSLPQLGELNCSGLILVVGPNSSGKSQFLRDIFHRIRGEPRELVVAKAVDINKPDWEPFVNCLEAEGYFVTKEQADGTLRWAPQTTYIGEGGIGDQQADKGRVLYDRFSWDPESARKRPNDFLSYYGRLLVTGLFLDRRLIALNRVGLMDFVEGSPQNDLQALYMNVNVRDALSREIQECFGVSVWPDASRGTNLVLKVSDAGVIPSDRDRLQPKEMAQYREIESEGDGLKSYVAISLALLLGRRPICIIDEPEMCLHPPQAYNLGRFIGRNGASTETATFVATHSSNVLRGVIQTAAEIQIVRLTRKQGEFIGHLVPAATLREALAKPTVRAESVLDGIFAQCVVVVEGDGDRLVYQTVWETLASETNADAHFAPVSGTGGIADTCRLYRALKIPVAVVADLDMVADSSKLETVLRVLASESHAKSLADDAKGIVERIKALPPTVTESEVRRRLTAILEAPLHWEADGDVDVKNALSALRNDLVRLRKLKRGGLRSFAPELADDLTKLLNELAVQGLFLVPVGELEEWLEHENLAVPKRNKWAWANAASQRIQDKGAQEGDIWSFIRGVAAFLTPDQASATLTPLAAVAAESTPFSRADSIQHTI